MTRIAKGWYTGEIDGRKVVVTCLCARSADPTKGYTKTPNWRVVDAETRRVLSECHRTMNGAIQGVRS